MAVNYDHATQPHRNRKLDFINLGADHLTSEGGGGGGWMILKKNILQVHMHKKKILAQDHRAKKNTCTNSELGKKFWQALPWADTLNFINQQTVKRFLASGLGY